MEPFWLAAAKALPAGHSRKISCCAADRSLNITNGKDGYLAHCHRCREGGFVKHGQWSLDQLAQRRAEFALQTTKEVALPKDFTLDIPSNEASWLWLAGIRSDIARFYGFGYSPFLERVVLPVYHNGQLIGYTARKRHGKPKYIEKAVDPAGIVFRSDDRLLLPSGRGVREALDKTIVITEDVLSAVRVGRVLRARAVLGTGLHVGAAFALLREVLADRVIIWLDGDKAGKDGSRRLAGQYRLLGAKVRELTTPKDPKLYSNDEIKEFLLNE